MLEHISVKNIGLVSQADIEFSGGFSAFTGETGAGKSMLLSSLLVLFGSKADSSVIRHGEERAEVSSRWDISALPAVRQWLEEQGFESSSELILRCVITRGKKKQCFIQGVAAPAAQLFECMEMLCEIHAQHEHQALFKESAQREILDAYAGITARKKQFAKDLSAYKKKKTQWQQLCDNEAAHRQEMENLRFTIETIDRTSPREGEDAALSAEIARKAHAQEIARQLDIFAARTIGSEGSEESLQRAGEAAIEALDALLPHYAELASARSRLQSALLEISDVADEVVSLRAQDEESGSNNLAALEERLAEIELLKKKYGGSIARALALREAAQKKIGSGESFGEYRDALFEELKHESKRLMAEADALHGARKKAAQQFSAQVTDIIKTLAMNDADFLIAIPDVAKDDRKLSSWGYGALSFTIRSNAGEPHKNIASVASGGELSRIMLAIRMAAKNEGTAPTLVLDEVDAGIGGKTAVTVGRYLADLGGALQVICVTHVPVIAAAAAYHYHVSKIEASGRTHVSVQRLSDDERLREIARMLVGNEDDELARSQARKMLSSREQHTQ